MHITSVSDALSQLAKCGALQKWLKLTGSSVRPRQVHHFASAVNALLPHVPEMWISLHVADEGSNKVHLRLWIYRPNHSYGYTRWDPEKVILDYVTLEPDFDGFQANFSRNFPAKIRSLEIIGTRNNKNVYLYTLRA